jgi:hypothetical protein
MGFSRSLAPQVLLGGDSLAGAMAGLGMSIAATPTYGANIEDVLLAASRLGMEEDNFRVLGVLVAWSDMHRARINADRLTRVVSGLTAERTRMFWAAMAGRWQDDRRWRRLAAMAKERGRIELLRVGSAFQLRRHGEDPRFQGSPLIVPSRVLRNRPGDVRSPEETAKQHTGYRLRVQMGPVYRTDAWTVLAADPELSASALARQSYVSFATAWQVKKDFAIFSS